MPVKQHYYELKEGSTKYSTYFLEDTTGLPKYFTFEIHSTADPEDLITVFTAASDGTTNVFEVNFRWDYETPDKFEMDADFMGSSILFDMDDRDARDRLAPVLAKLCTYYRRNVNPVFGCGWNFVDGAQKIFINTNRPDLLEAPADLVVDFPAHPECTYEHIGLNPKMLEDQIKVRKFGNKVDFEHGLPHFNAHIKTPEDIPKVKFGQHQYILADTNNWTDWATTKAFLGACKHHRIHAFCSAKSSEYTYGTVPSWVQINPYSRVGVIDMLRPGTPAPQFHWVGITDYIQLDYRCPQFAYHVGRMGYNPRIQIIVVLHDIASDIPESMDEDGRSPFHERQFKTIGEAVGHQNNRKPILFKVSIPGIASALHRAGVHVSPTVKDCMSDLDDVISRYMDEGEITWERATAEIIEDTDELAAVVVQKVARRWLQRRKEASIKIQNFFKNIH